MGIGFIADFHFNAFKKLSTVEIAGITRDYYGSKVDQEKQYQRLLDKAAAFNIKVYRDFDDIVADPAIDALIIGSVNTLHYTQVMKAIARGKHVLVEKPLLIDLSQYVEIEKQADAKQVVVFPAHNFVYRTAIRKAKEIINSGVLGKIIYGSFISTHQISTLHARGWRAKKTISAGGSLMDSGHHQIYQSLYLLGKPSRLQAFTSRMYHLKMESEDTALVNLQYANGTVGTIMQSWASDNDAGSNAIRIIGDAGSLCISDALYHNNHKINEDTSYEHSFEALARAFAECLRNGVEPLSTIRDSMATLRLVFSAYESAAKNTIIEF